MDIWTSKYLSISLSVSQSASIMIFQCVDRVLSVAVGELNAFAVIRPPGHHAGISEPSGFCIFNNVAVATKDNRVLYMSVHRHDNGLFYPVGDTKDYVNVGKGKGKGYSFNLPWNHGRIDDEAYRAAFGKVIMPIAYEFNPELVFISAGFDAAMGDPLGECMVNPDTFALMTYQLTALAGGRVIVALEGGWFRDYYSTTPFLSLFIV
uniref:Hist_deacetyl domain-containing protein n=1 Tax=Angiostrongylus cantonensis TaxID=6313 RepID=A0A0K0DIQ1_ANGCA